MSEARITVDPAFRIGPVDPRVYGSFVEVILNAVCFHVLTAGEVIEFDMAPGLGIICVLIVIDLVSAQEHVDGFDLRCATQHVLAALRFLRDASDSYFVLCRGVGTDRFSTYNILCLQCSGAQDKRQENNSVTNRLENVMKSLEHCRIAGGVLGPRQRIKYLQPRTVARLK